MVEEPSSNSNNLAWDPFILVSFLAPISHISLKDVKL
jgi:hypothetical protein